MPSAYDSGLGGCTTSRGIGALLRRMTSVAAALAVLAASVSACTSTHDAGSTGQSTTSGLLRADEQGVVRPDRILTPGSVDPGATTAQLCTPTYLGTVALSSDADRQETFLRYGLPYPTAQDRFRLDHAVPVEIGGDSSAANLWPMPVSADVADRKNALAVRLHDLVCAGTVPLGTAQQDVATDWYAAWRRYVVEMSPSPGTPTPSGPSVQLAGPESAESTTTPTSTTGPTSAPPSRGSTPSPTAAPKPAPVPSQPVAAAPTAPAAPEPVTPAAPAPLAPASQPSPPAPLTSPATPSTAPATSSSPEPAPSSTASSSSSATPAGSAARGQACAPVGATGQTANGRTLVCATTGNWQPAGG